MTAGRWTDAAGAPLSPSALFADLAQGGGAVLAGGIVALEQLPRSQQNLIGSLSPARTTAHAVGHHAQYTTRYARVGQQCDLILLVFAIPLVDAGRCAESISLVHILVVPGEA